MTEAVDPVIPLSVLARRFERHRDQLRRDLAALPWWRLRRRSILLGAISTYGVELEAILEIGGKTQPVWQTLGDRTRGKA